MNKFDASSILKLYDKLDDKIEKLWCLSEECCQKIPINIGEGIGLYKRLFRGQWEFKSLIAGTNITITDNGNDLTINSTGGDFDCQDVLDCLGISPSGDPDKFLNEEGDFLTITVPPAFITAISDTTTVDLVVTGTTLSANVKLPNESIGFGSAGGVLTSNGLFTYGAGTNFITSFNSGYRAILANGAGFIEIGDSGQSDYIIVTEGSGTEVNISERFDVINSSLGGKALELDVFNTLYTIGDVSNNTRGTKVIIDDSTNELITLKADNSVLVSALAGVGSRMVVASATGLLSTQAITTGTVTSVSVVSANGFAGSVATATTTPAITLSTTITGLLKGNGTAISAAVGDVDYQNPITLTTTGSSGAATFVGDVLNIPNYSIAGLSPLTTKGDLFTYSTVNTRLGIGADATILMADSAATTGNKWVAISSDATIATTGALTLATVNATTGTFGSATQTGQFTVNAKGLITAASNVTITPAASSITGGQALTKTDDTNVTLTLGGTPTTALLQATSLTLGWTGNLAVTRGGTSNNTFTAYSPIYAGTTATGAFQSSTLGASGTVLTSTGTGSLPTWQTPSSGITIDSTSITSGASSRILFENASNQVSESSLFTYLPTSGMNLGMTAGTGTQAPLLTITSPAHTALTASTEYTLVNIPTATLQFATGTLATQEKVKIIGDTISFVGASTAVVTSALTVTPTIRGTNANMNSAAIYVPATAVGAAVNAYGLQINAPTGATNTYAAKFEGGNATGATVKIDNGGGNNALEIANTAGFEIIFSNNLASADIHQSGTGLLRLSTISNSIQFSTDALSNIGANITSNKLFVGGSTAATAKLHIAAGSATADTAPLKFTSGTNTTIAVAGQVEYNNTFHVTNSDATRRHIATAPNTTKVTAGAPYTNDGYIVINIGGTDFKIMTTA